MENELVALQESSLVEDNKSKVSILKCFNYNMC